MATRKRNTLKNLSKVLQEQKSPEPAAKGAQESDEFIKSEPKTLVGISKLKDSLKANQDPDEAFLVEAVEKLAELKGITTREVLYSLIKAVMGQTEKLNAGDVLLLSSVQYLAHRQQVDAKLEELLKE